VKGGMVGVRACVSNCSCLDCVMVGSVEFIFLYRIYNILVWLNVIVTV
jgi:hypothetical protein